MRTVLIDHYGLCEVCHGDGCRDCGNTGEQPAEIAMTTDELAHLYPWANPAALPTARTEQETGR